MPYKTVKVDQQETKTVEPFPMNSFHSFLSGSTSHSRFEMYVKVFRKHLFLFLLFCLW